MRIILFTGKGGTGKTTISAATAIKLAEKGKKVLVISVDPAHSLSDVLDAEIGPEPTKITENLWAQEVDVYYSVERFWGRLKEYLKSLLKWQGLEDIVAEELSILPGMEEVASFLWINNHLESKEFDIIVVDSAPTGETLRLLSLPDAASWWVTKVLPVQRKIVRFIKPAAKLITDMPLPEEETYDALEELFRQVYNLYFTLQNPEISTIRIVTNPEKMVIKESERAYTYLHLFSFPVDAVIINKIANENSPIYELQKNYIERIERSFEPTPVLKVPHKEKEIIGIENLKELGNEIYKDLSPDSVLYRDKPFTIEEMDGKKILRLVLKNPPKEKLDIFLIGDDLTIKIGNFKKHFFLPKALMGKNIEKAIIRESFLEIIFS